MFEKVNPSHPDKVADKKSQVQSLTLRTRQKPIPR